MNLQTSSSRRGTPSSSPLNVIALLLCIVFSSGCATDRPFFPVVRPATDSSVAPLGTALSAERSAKATQLEPNKFRVECTSLKPEPSEQQLLSDWCWAACAQMVLRSQGQDVSQSEIAMQIRGGSEQQQAQFSEIMWAMNPDLLEQLSDRFIFSLSPMVVTSDDMLSELSQGQPAVVGIREYPDAPSGHACVLFAATYGAGLSPTLFSDPLAALGSGVVFMGKRIHPSALKYALYEVEVYDPWPGVGKRVLSGQDFAQQVDFMISRKQARDILQKEIEKLPPSARIPPAPGSIRADQKAATLLLTRKRDFDKAYPAFLSLFRRLDSPNEISKERLTAQQVSYIRISAHYNMACIYVHRGENGKAIDELEKSFQAGYWTSPACKIFDVDKDLDPIRSNPRLLENVQRHRPRP